ncbi:unnamed protein product [Closterium sp. Naga37s-1]|nr:unnamed protein product [Closterium sp. Naga37s-1]
MQKAPTAGLDPEIVQALPTVTFSREKLHEGCCESFRECAVCLGEYEDGECVKTLPSCGHRFHATCIDIWFCAHTTCPICRFNLKPPKHPSQQEDSQGRTSDAGDSGDSSERHATANDEEDPSTTVSETTADSVSIEVEIVDNLQQQHEIVEMDSSSEALARPPVVRAAAVAETGEADASSAAAAVGTAGTDASCELAGIRVPAVVESSAIPAAAVVSQRRRTGETDRRRLQRGDVQEDEELQEDEEEDSGLKEGRSDWELGLGGGESSGGDRLCVRIEV